MELVHGHTFDQEVEGEKEREQAEAWEKEERDRRKAAQMRGRSDGGTRSTKHRHELSDRHGGNGVRRWRSEVREACPTRPAEVARLGRHRQVSTSRNLDFMKDLG